MEKKYTDQQLLTRVESLPMFKGFPKVGFIDVWVRSKKDEFNVFDDKVYTFECFPNKEPQFKMVCTGTTNAGQFGLEHFDKYNSTGCAVLQSDCIIYDSHVYGLHKGKPAYVQSKGFPYYRDGNKDQKADETGKVYNNIIGANCHRAGANSTIIANWSTACLVRNIEKSFLNWLLLMNKKPLTIAILKEF